MVIADVVSEGGAKSGRRKRRIKSTGREEQRPKRETGNRKRSKKGTKKDEPIDVDDDDDEPAPPVKAKTPRPGRARKAVVYEDAAELSDESVDEWDNDSDDSGSEFEED